MKGVDIYSSHVPIYHQKKERETPYLVGTAVLLSYLNRGYLFTAAHVLDHWKYGDILAPTESGITPLEGTNLYIPLKPGERKSDKFDAACIKLENELFQELQHFFVSIPQERQNENRNSLDLSVCSISGYPINRTKKLDTGSVTSVPWAPRGVACLQTDYEEYGYSPYRNILVRFNRKEAIDHNTGKQGNTPSLRGLSRRGIYSWSAESILSTDWTIPKLVGIFHTYVEKQELIVGTSLHGYYSHKS